MPEVFTHTGIKLRQRSREGGCLLEIEFYSTVPEIPLLNERDGTDALHMLAKKARKAAVEISLKIAHSDLSELEKADAVYEYLIRNVEYGDTENPYSYTAYAALYDGKAVCQGYSAAFNLLCDALGVKAVSYTHLTLPTITAV